MDFYSTKIGILGAGQLGKMLCLAAAKWQLPVAVLDADETFPAVPYAIQFFKGDFNNYDDVVAFGKQVDIITIEIEHVNLAALQDLESIGKIVHPSPAALAVIKDKGLQKQFYQQHNLPSGEFILLENKQSILDAFQQKKIKLPFVQKLRTGGYDGKGVQIIYTENELSNLFDAPCVIEKLVQIKKEIAVIAARNESGEVATYPPVEMVFDPVANLVDTLLMPAQINKIIQNEAIIIAEETIKKLNIVGLLAVELFLDEHDNLLINEVAPRPHNSGHQTIEACITSQFEQHIRAILNLPLGSTSQHKIACMINILGEENYTGNVKYIGLEKCLASSGIHVHLYGKKKTKPKRKMGHITILGENIEEIYQKISIVKNNVKAISI